MDACGLIDLGAMGPIFTWCRKIQGMNVVSKRLDRALANIDWRARFSEAFVENLTHLHSNHYLILVRCRGIAEQGCSAL